jgi:hypothetical protein
LVLGIVSILMFWTAFLDIVLVIAASVFGAAAISDRGSRRSTSRRLAVAGLACAAIGAVAAIAWTVYVVHIINNCGGFNQPNTSGLRSCLQRQL